MSETPPALQPDLSRCVPSALIWPLFALPVLSYLITTVSQIHYSLAGPEADAIWAAWYESDHPAALFVWGGVFLLALSLMGFWLQRRGVWQVIARAGRYDLAAIGLAMAGVGVNWMLSEMIYSSAAAITGNPDLPVNRPGYEWELTAENVWSDVFSAGIAAPLFEETAFRGLMLGVLLARGWQTWPAVLVTAAAFALTHGQYYFVGVLDIFAAGIVFGALRIYSGGLFAPMLCHSAMNLSITFTEWNALQDEPLALMRLLS